MNERAVFYARVSTEEEKQINALEKQCLDLEDCINANGWIKVDSYIDEGKSGSTIKKRDEYNRLYDDMSSDKFDIIVVKSLDRLNRNEMDWYLFLNELTQNQKKLFIYMDNCFFKKQDSMLAGIKSILNAEYSRELSRKLNNAHKRREQAGSTVMTNGNIWGYDQVKGELVINEKEAKIVKRIYEMYVYEKRGIREIINQLDAEDITAKNGKKFGTATINRILTNEKYIGVMICNKQHKDFYTKKVIKNPKSEWIIHENRLPVIIDKDVFEMAQQIRKGRRQTFNPNGNKVGKRETKHSLGGKIFCGCCGKVMWYNAVKKTNKKGGNNGYRYPWICSTFSQFGRLGTGRFPNEGCNKKNINDQYLSDEIIMLINGINTDESKNELFNKMMINIEEIFSSSNNAYDLDKLKSEIIDIENKQGLLVDKYLDGVIPESVYTKKNAELENNLINKKNELEKIQKKIDEEKNKEEKLNFYKNMITTLFSGTVSYEEFCNMVSKIIAYDERIEIYLYVMGDVCITINKSLEFITNSFKATEYKDARIKR